MGDAPIDLAPIRGTDDTLNTLVFIRCRHPLALEMIPSNSLPRRKLNPYDRRIKLKKQQ